MQTYTLTPYKLGVRTVEQVTKYSSCAFCSTQVTHDYVQVLRDNGDIATFPKYAVAHRIEDASTPGVGDE